MKISQKKQDFYRPNKKRQRRTVDTTADYVEKPEATKYVNYTILGKHIMVDKSGGPVLSLTNTLVDDALAIKETTVGKNINYFLRTNVDGRLYNPMVGNVRRPLVDKNTLVKVTPSAFLKYLKFLTTSSLSWLKAAESEVLDGS